MVDCVRPRASAISASVKPFLSLISSSNFVNIAHLIPKRILIATFIYAHSIKIMLANDYARAYIDCVGDVYSAMGRVRHAGILEEGRSALNPPIERNV